MLLGVCWALLENLTESQQQLNKRTSCFVLDTVQICNNLARSCLSQLPLLCTVQQHEGSNSYVL